MKKFALAITSELAEILNLEDETNFQISPLMKEYFATAIGGCCRGQWYLAASALNLFWKARHEPGKFRTYSPLQSPKVAQLTSANLKGAVAYCRDKANRQVDYLD